MTKRNILLTLLTLNLLLPCFGMDENQQSAATASGLTIPGPENLVSMINSNSAEARQGNTTAIEIISACLEMLETWAEGGNQNAQFNLGYYYGTGTFLKQDYSKAIKWYSLAFEQGNKLAGENLKIRYNELLHKMASEKNAPLLLGLIKEKGFGVSKDIKIATQWYKIAASQGLAAQEGLQRIEEENRRIEEIRKFGHLVKLTERPKSYATLDSFEQLKDVYGNVHASNPFLVKTFRKPVQILNFVSIVDRRPFDRDNDTFFVYDPSVDNLNLFAEKKKCYLLTTEEKGEFQGIEDKIKEKLKENYKYEPEYSDDFAINYESLSPIIIEESSSGDDFKRRYSFDAKAYFQAVKNKAPESPYDKYYNKPSMNLQATANSMGNLVFAKNYIINNFISLVKPGMRVLDLGAGTGGNAYLALQNGAQVTSLDIAVEHLLELWHNTDDSKRKNLTLNNNSFPNKINFPPDSHDVVLMSYLAHYLSGPEFRDGVKKVYEILPKNGYFLFQTLTPYAKPYFIHSLEADTLLEQKAEWPGYLDGRTKMVKQVGMPKFGHPFHFEILKRELERVGFEIIYINYNDMYNTDQYPITAQEINDYIKNRMGQEKEAVLESSLNMKNPDFLARLMVDKKRYQTLSYLDAILKGRIDEDIKEYFYHETYKELLGDTFFLSTIGSVEAIAVKK